MNKVNKAQQQWNEAVIKTNLDEMKRALESEGDINLDFKLPWVDVDRTLFYSALQIACHVGHEDMVSWLLQQNVNVHIKTKKNESLITLTIRRGLSNSRQNIVRHLLLSGADVNEIKQGESYLSQSLFDGKNALSLSNFLIDRGADVQHVGPDGSNALHNWLYGRDSVTMSDDEYESFIALGERLKNAGVDPHRVMNHGMTLVHLAAEFLVDDRIWKVLREWFKNTPNIWSQRDEKDRTPLFIAVEQGNVKAAAQLLKQHRHGVSGDDLGPDGAPIWSMLNDMLPITQKKFQELKVNHEKTVLREHQEKQRVMMTKSHAPVPPTRRL